jgi:hypothetical protein
LLASANYLARGEADEAQMQAFEVMLASGLKEFIAELVTIDGAVLVTCICNDQHANLDDIIGSSLEQTVRPHRLCYGNRAKVDFDWGRPASVALGMELRDDRLTAFFQVVLAGDHVGIDIEGVHFTDRVGEPAENLRRFAAAVADAQLPRQQGAPRPR